MYPASFEYFAPTSLDQAVSVLERSGDEGKVLAGGQSLIPLMKLRVAAPRAIVDINRVAGLHELGEGDGQAGSDAEWAIFPNVRPLRYPDGNVVRDVEVRGNSVSGTLVWSVAVQVAGGSRNRAEDVRIVRNTIRSTVADGHGVYAFIDNGQPVGQRYGIANRIAS